MTISQTAARPKIVTVRWSDAEWSILQARARDAHLSVSAYIREKCLKGRKASALRDRNVALYQAARLAVTIDRLVHVLERHGVSPPPEVQAFRTYLDASIGVLTAE